MTRRTVAVVFGGVAEEHDVSVRSAMEVARDLNLAKYDPVFIGITRSGAWITCTAPAPGFAEAGGRRVVLSPDRTRPGLLVEEAGGWREQRVDVVLPVLHGRFGEDGALQGVLALAGIPFAGCGAQSGMLAMDKALTYLVAADAGVAVPPHRVLHASGAAVVGLEAPLFVKPARSGSSFGVTRVDRVDDLPSAVAEAAVFDGKVLVEQAIEGREVGCAVLEGDGGDLIVGEVDEIRLSDGFFRIHQEAAPELGSLNSTVVVPAHITPVERERVQQVARTVFRALGCRGLARVDSFLLADGRVVLNEVNTFPGLTSYSRFPRMMAAAGLPLPVVLDRLIDGALQGTTR